jgi:hypothetical protein
LVWKSGCASGADFQPADVDFVCSATISPGFVWGLGFARELHYPFNPTLRLICYFLRAPVWMLANLLLWVQLLLRGKVELDWKT